MNTSPDASNESDVLAALVEEENGEEQLVFPRRPIHVRRNSKGRDLLTYGTATSGFLTLLVAGVMAYSNLCHDAENATKAAKEATAANVEAVKKIEANAGQIGEVKVTLQRVDTTQQEVKANLEERMTRQDAVLDRILDKLDNN